MKSYDKCVRIDNGDGTESDVSIERAYEKIRDEYIDPQPVLDLHSYNMGNIQNCASHQLGTSLLRLQRSKTGSSNTPTKARTMNTKHTIQVQNLEFSFEDSDIANPDDFIADGDYNPHNIRLWLIHDHGFTVGCAFASNLSDALDTLVDKLDSFKIDKSDYDDYDINSDSPTCAFLGDAGEAFDIEALGCVEILSPPMSIIGLFKYQAETKTGYVHLGC